MGLETQPAVPSVGVRRMAFVLMAAATLATELATLIYGEPLWRGAAAAVGFVAAAVVLGRLAPRPDAGTFRLPRGFTLLLGVLVLSPFLLEPPREDWTGNGRPLEVQMVAGFRNLGLGLAALAAWPVCLRLACLVSLFLMLCAVLLADDLRVLPVLAVYSAAGVAWLGLAYWERVRSAGPAGAVAARPPWGVIGAAALLVSGVLALTAAGPDRAAAALGELLPTSGGTGRNDPRSRGGVNDGDEETRGSNPRSTGFADAEQFLESPLPSLYDSFNDLYGEPARRDRVEQAIAIDPSKRPPDLPKPPPDSLRPGRQFATTRATPRRPRDPGSRAARGLFEVDGPTPLHVRAAAFDFYDGTAWHEAPPRRNGSACTEEDGWMVLDDTGPTSRRPFRGTVEHRIHVADLKGALVPTPPHVERFRVGRVNRPDFFAWSQEGILRMSRRDLPGGVTVDTVSRVADPEKLRQSAWAAWDPPGPPAYLQTPPGQDDLARLARVWVDGMPRGWPQVEAVTARLREAYTLDPQARAPADCRDTTRHFLLASRRGPDYEFASAAALLLRHLGYGTRLASGYYARPEGYDPASGHTPVTGDDVHFWPEVLLPGRVWAVIEPTPGYDVLTPAPSLAERVEAALRRLGDWCAAHPVGSALAFALPAALLFWRKRWRDYLGLLWLLAAPGRSWRDWVLHSARLLDRRGRWAGRARPAGLSPRRWYAAAVPDGVPARDSLLRLARLADWAAFAPGEPPEPPEAVWSACRSALAEWTLPRFRATRPTTAGAPPCPGSERKDG